MFQSAVMDAAYAEILGIEPPAIEAFVPGDRPNFFRLLVAALLEHGSPMSADEVADRLERAGVESRVGDLRLSVQRAWRGRSPVYRDEVGRFALDPTAPEVGQVLEDLGLSEAARTLPGRRMRAAQVGRRLVVRTLWDEDNLRAVVGQELKVGSAIRSWSGRARTRVQKWLEGASVVAGVRIEPLLDLLDVSRDNMHVIELTPPAKTIPLDRRGRMLTLTKDLVVHSSTGIKTSLSNDTRLVKDLAARQTDEVYEKLVTDLGALVAFYGYGVLHGKLRVRWGFLDESLPVAWAEPGDPRMQDILRRSANGRIPVNISWNEPGKGLRHEISGARVRSVDAWRVGLQHEQQNWTIALQDIQWLLPLRDIEGLVIPSFVNALSDEARNESVEEDEPVDEQEEAETKETVPAGSGAIRPLGLAVTPQGHLRLNHGSDSLDAEAGVSEEVAERIESAFSESVAAGLLHLAFAELTTKLPPSLNFGRLVAGQFLHDLCHLPEGATAEQIRAIDAPRDEVSQLVFSAPPMVGGEYLSEDVVRWARRALARDVSERLANENIGLAEFLSGEGGDWHALGRVWFHLAENPEQKERPFAFLATYTPGLSASGTVRHTPLGNALEDMSDRKSQLLHLFAPVRRAAERSPFVREMMDTGEVFHPVAWTASEAHEFLRQTSLLDGTGIKLRLPHRWGGHRPKRPKVELRIGEKGTINMGVEALLDFDLRLALDGEPLTEEERTTLMTGEARLEWLRGQWVEVDPNQLQEAVEAWSQVGDSPQGVDFVRGLRMLAGLDDFELDGGKVVAGEWLADALRRLSNPDDGSCEPSPYLRTKLRPYQQRGLGWLWTLYELGLGGCLADDMGLGKTVQLIALLLRLQDEDIAGPHLLVLPASLIGNWLRELERFAPSLTVSVVHRAHQINANWDEVVAEMEDHDIIITTYGMLSRVDKFFTLEFGIAVLDEAQAIKNPDTQQSQAVKKIRARCRVALTGTPIENRLQDLWSLFDYLNGGLLGTEGGFKQLTNRMRDSDGPGYAPLRRLVRPYILRRLKTDKTIIADLPDKTEVNVYCALSKRQVALYEQAAELLAKDLKGVDGIERRGVVLAFLTRFKQICNHPSQWLHDDEFDPKESGKFRRLHELAETIAERQEKVLVFTQYREMTGPLSRFLGKVFGRTGCVLHGGTPVRERPRLVEEFQQEDGPPYFVLSLKAGGTGLNLTAASHVVHFDRWWNPAVENQATDRAYRIGQHRNVLVHRFVCQGTLEERIDAMLTAKQQLADSVLSFDGGQALTEMSDDELLEMVRLDMRSVWDPEEA